MDKADKHLLRLIGIGADKLSDNAMLAIVCVEFIIGMLVALFR